MKRNYPFVIGAFILILVVGVSVIATACGGDAKNVSNAAQDTAVDTARNRKVYEPKNDIEGRNYNWREEIADDPTTILWCTTAWPIPSSPLITVPVVGKLTSSNKRAFPTSQAVDGSDSRTTYNPDLPDSNGFFGTSSDYRYGFGPTGKAEYYDFYGMPTFCTNVPLTYQRENTTIVMDKDNALLDAQVRAQAELAKHTPEGDVAAQKILLDAISKVKR